MLGFGAMPAAIAQSASCEDLTFSGDVLNRFPRANEACLDVAVRDGKQYAHFTAEIQRVSGSSVYARFKRRDGGMTETFKFTPPASARVKLDGRQYRYRELARGQEISVYVPQDRWAVAVHESEADLMAASSVALVALDDADDDEVMAAALPDPASPMPLIGLLGMIFVGLGSGVGWMRRRFTIK